MTTLIGIIWIISLTVLLVRSNKQKRQLEIKARLADSKYQLLKQLHPVVNLDAERE